MNIQNLMKQAQNLQKKMMESKNKIEAEIFEGKSELVIVKINGKREVLSVKIKKDENFDLEDIEILEDMITIAMNDALRKIDKKMDEILGSQANLMGGLL